MPSKPHLMIFAVLLTLPLSAQVDVSALARSVDERYNRLQSLSAEFTEIYRGQGMARTESGTMWLKRPGRMRWEYRTPREKLFVTDGKTAYFYLPDERQVRRAPVKKLDDLRSPLRYLLGKSKLLKEFPDLAPSPDLKPLEPANTVLRGAPEHLADRVQQVWLEIAPDSRITRIVIEEVDGSTTEFRFRYLTENQLRDDAQFRFTPPAGTEVIETEAFEP
ncbi:MAG TPA: outer membrane lipoprotein chaperone LolA [Terriglobales bacterium]|nr:outer membrane lipoprotein chaperone LolA [Terriglobales bacterium]